MYFLLQLSDSANCQNKEHSTSTECGDIGIDIFLISMSLQLQTYYYSQANMLMFYSAALPSKPLHGSGVGYPVQ